MKTHSGMFINDIGSATDQISFNPLHTESF